MQKITKDQLLEKAAALLENGTVSAVLGWQKGEFDYDITPALFESKEELEANFVWNDFAAQTSPNTLLNTPARLREKFSFS